MASGLGHTGCGGEQAGCGPRIAAVVCAHNDAPVVADAVESLLAQSLPPHAHELIAIDNASTDGTGARLVSQAERSGGRLRVVREEERGLSAARNRALAEATAPIVAFLDADAVADRNWLAALLAAFEQWPGAAAVGGAVRIRWDHERPRWWTDRLAESMNAFCPGPDACRLTYPRYPYGTNFAVRREAATSVGGFEPSLGRNGRSLIAAEEGELCMRLERAGWEIRFEPHALVHHRTSAGRLTRRYVLKRAFSHGRSQSMLESRHGLRSTCYLSWPALAAALAWRAIHRQCDLAFLKYFLFRLGYHAQRSLLSPGEERP